MTLIYFVLILGIVVFVHELGHFLFAKKAGIYVYEFSIGMGPRLFKFNRKKKKKKKDGTIEYIPDETDYSIRLLPIGGFVQMAGEEVEADEKIPEDKRLQSKPWGSRFMTMVAGVLFNFILGIIVLLIIGWSNVVQLNSVYVSESVNEELPVGAKIVKVAGKKIHNYDRLTLELTVHGDKPFEITVQEEDGMKKNVTINPIAVGESGMILGYDYGFSVQDTLNEDGIEELVIANSKNDELKDGLVITAVDGTTVKGYLDYLELIRDKNENFTITTVDSKGKTKDVQVKVTENKDDQLSGYSQGFQVHGTAKTGFFAGIQYAFGKFFSMIEQMIFTVWYLITGTLSLQMLSGPVGIFSVVGEAASSAAPFMSLLSLVALISVNVGFINILPLPAFDGGHALFLIIEKIKGSPVSPKVENTIHNIGFALLMLLMIYITYNDIIRIF